MSFKIEYNLDDAGWAECHVVNADGTHAAITASYLSDALGDLTRAIIAIASHSQYATASFEEEPGEYRWIFRRNADGVNMEIRSFPDTWTGLPDEKGQLLLATTLGTDVLVNAMVQCLSNIWTKHGEAGYKEKWVRYDFPFEQYQHLQKLVLKNK